MAVEIPVVIDIEQAFEDAAAKVGKALKPLQDILSKDALNLRFKIDDKSTRTVRKLLDGSTTSARELNTALRDVSARISAMQAKGGFIPGNLTAKEKDLLNVYTQLQMRIKGTSDVAKVFGKNVQKSLQGITESGKVAASAYSEANDAIGISNSRMATLIKNSVRLIALHTATNFIRNVREVTSEFELQKVALGSIIQDTERANTLFKQIKAAAVESPFEIKDLVTYTKQLSAYQIETEKLFDTTMKLADISAGLGVDMGRLILAFGQVRAASVLRGQELRQFTEAGIPLVDKLAEKFSELNGRIVSTSEVFELISKRAVPFSMIEDIFNDMTSAGGAFYQMQEKQAETLLGQWNNLKDSVSIMYDEIGNTTVVHNAMEALISSAKTLMQNWRSLAEVIKMFGASFAVVKVASLFLPVLTRNTRLAEKAELALARAEELEAITATNGAKARQRSIRSLTLYATYTKKASEATTMLGRGWNNLLAYFAKGGGISIAITLLTALAGVLVSVWKEARRLNQELAEIGARGQTEITQSVRTFERLARTATEAADGSKEQRDALDELKRSFGDISPVLDGHIESLRALKGNYESVTNAIREKVNWQIREQKITTITDTYGKQLGKDIDNVKKTLGDLEFTRSEISAITNAIQDAASMGIITAASTVEEKAKVIEDIIYKFSGRVLTISKTAGYGSGFSKWTEYVSGYGEALGSLAETSVKMENLINDVKEDTEKSVSSLGTYAKVIERIEKEIRGIDLSEGEKVLDPKSYAGVEKLGQETVKIFSKAIQDEFAKTKIDVSSAFDPSGQIDFNVLKEAAAEAAKITITEIDEATGREVKRTPFTAIASFVEELRKRYENIVPSDKIAIVTKRKLEEISKVTGVGMDKMRQYIKGSGTDDQEYMKGLSEAIDAYNKSAEKMVAVNSALAAGTAKKDAKPYSREQIEEARDMAKALEMLFNFMSQIIPLETHTSGRDNRLSDFKKDISEITNAYKKFVELRKYMNKESALFNIDEMFPTLKGWAPTYENMLSRLNEMLSDVQEKRKRSPKDSTLLDMERTIRAEIANIKFDKIKSDLDDELKKLSDELKRSETARNFYKNILDLTGDEELAATMGVSVYGDIGREFKDRMQKQLDAALGSLDADSLTDDLRDAFSTQNFNVILANLDKFPEEWQKRLKEMAESNEKYNADLIQNLLKTLEKAKTYGDKQVEIAKKSAERIAEINALTVPQSVKDNLLKQNAIKEAEETAKAQYEAFKESPMYIELFENLEGASTSMLNNMRENLIRLKGEWKNLSPRELRELQNRIDELDKQLATRNPFKSIVESWKEYIDLTKEQSRAEADETAENLNRQANIQKDLLEDAKKNYENIKNRKDATQEDIDAARIALEIQGEITDQAIEQADAAQETSNKYRLAAKHIQDAADGMKEWAGYITDALGGIGEIVDTFASDDTADTFNIISQGIGKTLGGLATTAGSVGRIMAGDLTAIPALIQGVGDVISGIFGTQQKLKIKEIDKQIKYQQDLLDDLTYSYDRLEKAMAKAFGSDYIYNYNKQLENLNAQIEAYNAQANLERGKGKKADAEKIKEYENNARDAQDQITEMQSQLSEFFSGTDLTSAAKDFASSWIEAYKEFGSTTDAMKERFQDLIESMVTQSLGAKIMQSILQPLFDEIDALAASGGELTTGEIAKIANEAPMYIDQINSAMTNLMNQLGAAGYNLRQGVGGFTGISRDIAGASEESITGLAAGINTQNFYMSLISQNVAAILAAMTGETVEGATGAAVPDPYKEQVLTYMGSLPQMRDDMYAIRTLLERVIKPLGTNATHYVATRM